MPIPEPDDVRQEVDHVRAETALVQANTELIKAKADLAGAGKLRDVAVIADVAETHARETVNTGPTYTGAGRSPALPEGQTLPGMIGSSGVNGSVQVRSDAAKGEATLLASYALTVAADRIVADLAATEGLQRVVLVSRGDHLQFGNYRQFLLQTDLLRQIFVDTAKDVEVLLEAEQIPEAGPPMQRPREAGKEITPVLALAGSVLAKAADLGRYFLTNYEIGGIAIAPAEVEQLISALAGGLVRKGINVVLFGRHAPQQSELSHLLGDLPGRIIDIEASICELGSRMKKIRQAAEQTTDPVAKNELQEAAARFDRAATRCRSALTRAGDFIAGLATADAKGVLLITKVAQEKAVFDQLIGSSVSMLIVDVCATVGNYYTRKNLWTFFGTMPFSVMGGAVVTYQLLDKNGTVRASGLVPVHSGYRSVTEVARLVNNSSSTTRKN